MKYNRSAHDPPTIALSQAALCENCQKTYFRSRGPRPYRIKNSVGKSGSITYYLISSPLHKHPHLVYLILLVQIP